MPSTCLPHSNTFFSRINAKKSTQLKENQVKKLATIKCSFKQYCFMTGDVLLLAVAESIS
jgi:hypothetical protein